MDARASRHLQTRLAVGAAAGERVEVVSVEDGAAALEPGEAGTLVSIGESDVHVLFDSGLDLHVDPHVVHLRPLRPPASSGGATARA
jgi:hypothetical protein